MAEYTGSFQVSLIDNRQTYVRYALTANPTSEEMHVDPDGMKYMGICTESESLVAPTDPSEYTWVYFGDNVTVQNIRTIYLATTEENIDDILKPWQNPEFVLYEKQGFVAVSQGLIGVKSNEVFWGYTLPDYDQNKYIYESMEMEMSDGTKVYTQVKRSNAWDAYYKLDIGGANLIRNSKTLIDDRIYWYERIIY